MISAGPRLGIPGPRRVGALAHQYADRGLVRSHAGLLLLMRIPVDGVLRSSSVMPVAAPHVFFSLGHGGRGCAWSAHASGDPGPAKGRRPRSRRRALTVSRRSGGDVSARGDLSTIAAMRPTRGDRLARASIVRGLGSIGSFAGSRKVFVRRGSRSRARGRFCCARSGIVAADRAAGRRPLRWITAGRT